MPQVERVSVEATKQEIIQTLKLQPANPDVGFNLWNVIGFYIAVIEAIWAIAVNQFILNIIMEVGSISLGYLIAYTLYWGILVKKNKTLAFRTLLVLLAYGAYCAFSVVFNLILIVPAVLYALKTLTVLMMLVNGFSIYKSLDGGASLLPQ